MATLKRAERREAKKLGHGWEVAEKYIEGQKGYYRRNDTVPVVMMSKKKKTHKNGCITFYTIFFATGFIPPIPSM